MALSRRKTRAIDALIAILEGKRGRITNRTRENAIAALILLYGGRKDAKPEPEGSANEESKAEPIPESIRRLMSPKPES